MKYIPILFLLVAVTLSGRSQTIYRDIKNYQVCSGFGQIDGQGYLVLRKFENEGKTFLLIVNPITLETKISESIFILKKQLSKAQIKDLLKNTSYQKALNKAKLLLFMTEDVGIDSGMPNEAGISLTADLCPSHRPLDRVIFTDIFNELGNKERPVPIALSVTGVWIRNHQTDLEWLKAMEQKREISIIWINHSFHHYVSRTLPLKQNFLLEAGTDINYEVLANEKAMLANGLMPSIFFRFPGLISDRHLVNTITGLGLIPVGTDAWLAKGQQPHAGSIVLIHGNGNEPAGVKDFINLLRSKAGYIANKQWLLYDLRESIENEFKDDSLKDAHTGQF